MLKALRDLGHDVPDTQANFVWLPAGPVTPTAGPTPSPTPA